MVYPSGTGYPGSLGKRPLNDCVCVCRGHGSRGSKDRVETDKRTERQTDGADCITLLANAFDKMVDSDDGQGGLVV